MALLQVRNVSKSFAAVLALQGVSFEVEAGEVLCVLGPSGCGKTTLLRVVAGLETPDAGQVLFEGRDLARVPPHHRDFGLMFQDYALFPHLDVLQNVAFGLRMKYLPQGKIQARVAEILELVGLSGYGRRDVNELSGGEQQRVALARSLAPNPRLLMLDEPLGSLDRPLRERLLSELRPLLKNLGITSLYVTHDQEEAFAVADRLIIMNGGRLVQEGPPAEVYRNPISPLVARFLGLTNLLPARLRPHRQGLWVETPLGIFTLTQRPTPPPKGGELTLLIRPEAAQVSAGPGEGDNRIEVTVEECSFRGSHYELLVKGAQGQRLIFQINAPAQGLPQPGDRIELWLRAEQLSLLGGSPHET